MRNAAQFLAAQGLGQVADAMTTLVVAEAVLGDGGGVAPSRLLATLGAAAVPYLVAGPLSGMVADRWDRRRTLFVVNVARAIVTLLALSAVAVDHRGAGLMAVAGLLGGARFVYNLRAAALPRTLPAGRRLVTLDASALRVGAFSVAAGGSLAALTGGRSDVGLLLFAAVLQVASAIGFLTLQCDLGGRSRALADAAGMTVGDAAARFARLLVSPAARLAIVMTSTHRVLLGATFATFVLIAANEYGLGARGYVVAAGVTGFGSMLGTFTAPRWSAALGTARLALLAFGAPAALLATTAVLRAEAYMIVALAAAFFLFQNLRVVADAMVQAAIVDDVRARVFSVYDALYNLSYFAGAALAVSLTDHSRPGLLAWVGVAYGVLAVVLGPFVARSVGSEHRPRVRRVLPSDLQLAGEAP